MVAIKPRKQYYPYLTLAVMKQDQVILDHVVACYIDERDYDWLASLNVILNS